MGKTDEYSFILLIKGNKVYEYLLIDGFLYRIYLKACVIK